MKNPSSIRTLALALVFSGVVLMPAPARTQEIPSIESLASISGIDPSCVAGSAACQAGCLQSFNQCNEAAGESGDPSCQAPFEACNGACTEQNQGCATPP